MAVIAQIGANGIPTEADGSVIQSAPRGVSGPVVPGIVLNGTNSNANNIYSNGGAYGRVGSDAAIKALVTGGKYVELGWNGTTKAPGETGSRAEIALTGSFASGQVWLNTEMQVQDYISPSNAIRMQLKNSGHDDAPVFEMEEGNGQTTWRIASGGNVTVRQGGAIARAASGRFSHIQIGVLLGLTSGNSWVTFVVDGTVIFNQVPWSSNNGVSGSGITGGTLFSGGPDYIKLGLYGPNFQIGHPLFTRLAYTKVYSTKAESDAHWSGTTVPPPPATLDLGDLDEEFTGTIAASKFPNVKGSVAFVGGNLERQVNATYAISEAKSATNITPIAGRSWKVLWPLLPTIVSGTGEFVDSHTVNLPNGGFLVTRLHVQSGQPTTLQLRLAEPTGTGSAINDAAMQSVLLSDLPGLNGIAMGFLSTFADVVFHYTADSGATWHEISRRRITVGTSVFDSSKTMALAHHMEILSGTPVSSVSRISHSFGGTDPTLDTSGGPTPLAKARTFNGAGDYIRTTFPADADTNTQITVLRHTLDRTEAPTGFTAGVNGTSPGRQQRLDATTTPGKPSWIESWNQTPGGTGSSAVTAVLNEWLIVVTGLGPTGLVTTGVWRQSTNVWTIRETLGPIPLGTTVVNGKSFIGAPYSDTSTLSFTGQIAVRAFVPRLLTAAEITALTPSAFGGDETTWNTVLGPSSILHILDQASTATAVLGEWITESPISPNMSIGSSSVITPNGVQFQYDQDAISGTTVYTPSTDTIPFSRGTITPPPPPPHEDPHAPLSITAGTPVPDNLDASKAKVSATITSDNDPADLSTTEPHTWWASLTGDANAPWTKLTHDGTGLTDTLHGIPRGLGIYLSVRDQAIDGTLSDFGPAVRVLLDAAVPPITGLTIGSVTQAGAALLSYPAHTEPNPTSAPYRIMVSTTGPSGTFTEYGRTAALTYPVSGTPGGSWYAVQIVGAPTPDGDGSERFSASSNVVALPAALTALTARRVEADGKYDLYWIAPPAVQAVDGVRIYRKVDAGAYPSTPFYEGPGALVGLERTVQELTSAHPTYKLVAYRGTLEGPAVEFAPSSGLIGFARLGFTARGPLTSDAPPAATMYGTGRLGFTARGSISASPILDVPGTTAIFHGKGWPAFTPLQIMLRLPSERAEDRYTRNRRTGKITWILIDRPVFARLTTDANGMFSVELPLGRYWAVGMVNGAWRYVAFTITTDD